MTTFIEFPAGVAPAMPRLIRMDDGCHVALRSLRAGDHSQPPVLFVHALAMNGAMWRDLSEVLQSTSPLYALDCRGHGASDRPPGPYTTRRFAQDIDGILDSLAASRVHLVGCSMGGTVSMAYAGLRPERLASLTVIDTTAWYGADARAAWEARAQRALNEGFEAMVPFQVERWFSEAYASRKPAGMRDAIDVFLANDAPAYAESCRMLGLADERPGLSRYAGPATVVVGEHDYATPPAMAQVAAQLLSGATLTVLPGLRHYTPIEAPEVVAGAIDAVIRRASAV
jgi:3-oxoadipate enol-lactonase